MKIKMTLVVMMMGTLANAYGQDSAVERVVTGVGESSLTYACADESANYDPLITQAKDKAFDDAEKQCSSSVERISEFEIRTGCRHEGSQAYARAQAQFRCIPKTE